MCDRWRRMVRDSVLELIDGVLFQPKCVLARLRDSVSLRKGRLDQETYVCEVEETVFVTGRIGDQHPSRTSRLYQENGTGIRLDHRKVRSATPSTNITFRSSNRVNPIIDFAPSVPTDPTKNSTIRTAHTTSRNADYHRRYRDEAALLDLCKPSPPIARDLHIRPYRTLILSRRSVSGSLTAGSRVRVAQSIVHSTDPSPYGNRSSATIDTVPLRQGSCRLRTLFLFVLLSAAFRGLTPRTSRIRHFNHRLSSLPIVAPFPS